MSGGGAEAGDNDGQSVEGAGQFGLGGGAYSSSGGGTDGGGVGDRWDGDGDGLNWWGDNVANVILGTEPNSTLAYAPGLELHDSIMSMIVGHGGRLDINKYIYIT